MKNWVKRKLTISLKLYNISKMKINTNSWNKLRYTLYTPGYDILGRIFGQSRKVAIDNIQIISGEKVLIIGAGTGLDLEFLPKDCDIVATDLTPAMVNRMKKRNQKLGLQLEAIPMDGQKLDYPDASFDKIILHLILAVIPDPVACLKEVERVLKPGGKISVFDKFVPKGQTVSFIRKIFNPLTSFLFSDITRSFETLLSNTRLKVLKDLPADFKGNFRIITLEKPVK